MIDMIGYNNNAWLLEAADDQRPVEVTKRKYKYRRT